MKHNPRQRNGEGLPEASNAQSHTLATLRQSLAGLDDRLSHLHTAVDTLTQLQQVQRTLEGDRQMAQAAHEVAQLQRQADELETALASYIISWQPLKERFWLAVRFGGLGIVVGWVLCSWVIGGR